jgi:PAS domain S-box-containing protein
MTDAIDGLSGTAWAAIIAGLVGLIGALAAFWQKIVPVRTAAWQAVSDAQQKRIDNLEKSYSTVNAELLTVTREHGKCMQQAAELIGDIKLLRTAIDRLQGVTGDTPPKTSLPIALVVDTDGKIYDVGLPIAGLLQYTKSELVGKNILLIVPERHKAKHLAGMVKVKEAGVLPLRDSPILTDALSKDGTEVPVALSLKSSWPADGKVKIYAEMQERGSVSPIAEKCD